MVNLLAKACALLLRTPVCPAAHGSSSPDGIHAGVTNASTGSNDSRYCAHASASDGPVGNFLLRVPDQVGRLLGDHDRRCIGVASYDLRHDRGVDDAQALYAVDT